MRKLLAVALLISPAGLIAFLPLTATQANAEEVRFATFNTFWLFDKDPPCERWAEQRETQTFDEAIEAVAGVIHSRNADIVALQEVEGPQVVTALNTKLASLGSVYPHVFTGQGTDNFTCQDVAILSKFPEASAPTLKYPNEKEIYWTELDGTEAETGISKGMNGTFDIHGEEVDIFVFHLKSQLGGHKADQQRLAQASIVRRLTLPAMQAERNVVVMGDLNADVGTPTLRRLRGLDDVFAPLYQPAEIDNVWPRDSGDRVEGQEWSHEFDGRGSLIDHILLSRALAKKVTRVEVMPRPEDASDHFPVVVDVDF